MRILDPNSPPISLDLVSELSDPDGGADRAKLLEDFTRQNTVAPSPWNSPSEVDDPGDVIIKRETGSRKRQVLKIWLREKLALGQNLATIVEFARSKDLETGNLLASIAAELETA